MLIHLVKKDILITKKYFLFMLLLAAAIPLFLAWRIPLYSKVISFPLAVIFTEFMYCMNISQKEVQYAKASALLSLTPYPRRFLVQSKYCLFLLLFVCCTILYGLETIFLPMTGSFDLRFISIVFLLISIAYGIFMPVQYKLGFEKTRMFFIIVIMASPVLLPAATAYGKFDPSFLLRIPAAALSIGLLLAGCAVLLASMRISVNIYRNTELL